MEQKIKELEQKQTNLQIKITELENKLISCEISVKEIREDMIKSVLENKILLTTINQEIKLLNDKILMNKERTTELKEEVFGLNKKLINVFIYITLGSISVLSGIKVSENILGLFF